jgi:hypothetical protein
MRGRQYPIGRDESPHSAAHLDHGVESSSQLPMGGLVAIVANDDGVGGIGEQHDAQGEE